MSNCKDCGQRYLDPLILKDDIFTSILKPEENVKEVFLCAACMERRLGRLITFLDLKPCGWTFYLGIGAMLARRANVEVEVSLEPSSKEIEIKCLCESCKEITNELDS